MQQETVVLRVRLQLLLGRCEPHVRVSLRRLLIDKVDAIVVDAHCRFKQLI